MALGTPQGAALSVALGAGVPLVSIIQVGELVRVSNPARHCFFQHISVKQISTRTGFIVLSWVLVSSQFVLLVANIYLYKVLWICWAMRP